MDEIDEVTNRSGKPHMGVDTVLVGAQIINNVQSIVSRSVDPIKSGLISICQFHAGSADNVIPQTATLRGTARSLLPEVRDTLENRLREVVEGTAKAYGARATLTYSRHYPVTSNHERETEFALRVEPDLLPWLDLEVERHACPGAGSCGGMYTANTMSSVIEAMGLSLPFSSTMAALVW